MDMQGYAQQEQLPPELLELLAGGATYEEAQAELEKKRALQEALRNAPSELQGRQAGGMFQANSPLEFLGDLAQQHVAGKQEQAIQGEIDRNRLGENRRVKDTLSEMNGMPLAAGSPKPMVVAQPIDEETLRQALMRNWGR